MGILSTSMRLHSLLQQKSDLEFNLTDLTEHITEVNAQILEKYRQAGHLDPNSQQYKQLEALRIQCEQAEKVLEQRQKEWQQKLQAVTQEIQGAEQMLAQNTKETFTYTLGGGQ